MRYLPLLVLIGALVLTPLACYAAPKTPTPSPTPTPVPLRIGALLSLSGSQPDRARLVRQALELSVEKLQAAGGINGRPVELIVEDTGAENVSPGTIIRALVTEKKSEVIVGDLDIEKTLPYISLANTYQTPLLSPALHDSALPKENQLAFGLYPRRPSMRAAMAKFFKTAGNPSSLVVFCNRTALGFGLSDAIKDVATENNIALKEEICADELLHDYRPDVMRAQGIGAGALFLTQGTTQTLQWMKNLGYSVPVLASPDFRDNVVIRNLELSQFEGAYFLDWPVRPDYVKEYHDRFGQDPILSAALAADAVDLMIEALKKSPNSVSVGLHQIRYTGRVATYDFTSEQAGNSTAASLFKIENGAITQVP